MEITLETLINALKKIWIVMLVAAVVLGAGAYIYSSKFIAKVYSSEASFFLYSEDLDTGTNNSGLTNNDVAGYGNTLAVGARAMQSFPGILLREDVMQKVLDYTAAQTELDPSYKLSRNYTAAQLLRFFSMEMPDALNGTSYELVFKVACRAYDPNDAQILVRSFYNIMNAEMADFRKDIFEIRILGNPTKGIQVEPSPMTNAAIGVFLGAVVPYIVCLVIMLIDKKVYRAEDLQAQFKHPVLGQIPIIRKGDEA